MASIRGTVGDIVTVPVRVLVRGTVRVLVRGTVRVLVRAMLQVRVGSSVFLGPSLPSMTL